MELEYRFELAEAEFKELAQGTDWEVSSVTDLTMGLSGATSMQTDHWIVRLRTATAEYGWNTKLRRTLTGLHGLNMGSRSTTCPKPCVSCGLSACGRGC
jgi:hypothetical protein